MQLKIMFCMFISFEGLNIVDVKIYFERSMSNLFVNGRSK